MNAGLKADLLAGCAAEDPVTVARIDGLLAQTPEDFAQADAQGDLLLVAWNDERMSRGSDVTVLIRDATDRSDVVRLLRKASDWVERGLDLEKREVIPPRAEAGPSNSSPEPVMELPAR